MSPAEIRFCRRCAAPTVLQVPALEDRERAVCTACGYIDYVNPANVVGTIPIWQDGRSQPRVLLCRRAIEPRRGYWTVPAGFQEVGETLEEGAVRETLEEAGARVRLDGLFAVLDVVRVAQVHLFFRARLLDLDLSPGPETEANRLVGIAEIPWDDLAFRSVRFALQAWVADHRAGHFRVHTGSITRPLPRDDDPGTRQPDPPRSVRPPSGG